MFSPPYKKISPFQKSYKINKEDSSMIIPNEDENRMAVTDYISDYHERIDV